VGCLCALGLDLPSCVDALFDERRPPAAPRRFTTEHQGRFPVYELPDAFWRTRHGKEAETPQSLTSRLCLAVAEQALAQAGLNAREIARNGIRVGVCVGTTVGAALNDEPFYRAFRAGENPELTPLRRYLASNPAEVLAKTYGLSGPVQTISNACASGSDAIGVAEGWIRAGLCDLALAGGADELCRFTYNGFISLMITDEHPCRPFDQERKGLNLGEGAALLVLESEELRRRRGAQALGYALGYGVSSDAHHLTAPHPQGAGLKRALEQALAQSGGSASDFAFVNAHGTGTPDNDRVESLVLAERLPGIPFLSTKGHTGHTLGAAGALEAAFTLACLARGELPPSAGCHTPDPALPVAPLLTRTSLASSASAALSFSLAFGGANAVLAFGLEP
jgi:3-oxoacyl-[acyl-carrier-protein] synthase-1/3-oxoacyl-[acyl-carrier-protein] synthase II